jgi:mannose-6-phosphate isomerase-like protein (cupin superfamily)
VESERNSTGAVGPAEVRLGSDPVHIAPDGSRLRVLCRVARASTVHFELAPHEVSRAVVHRTVDEIWYVLRGRGTIWREFAGRATQTEMLPGLSLTLPVGTRFQFRNTGACVLAVLGVTVPPWSGDGEAVPVAGPWKANV